MSSNDEKKPQEDKVFFEGRDWREEMRLAELARDERLRVIGNRYLFYIKLAVCFGILFTFCFHDFDENFNGIVYPIFAIGLFLFAYLTLRGLDKRVEVSSIPCLVAAGLLAISSFLTANGFVLFFNTVGIGILFSVFLCKQFFKDGEWGVGHYFIVIMNSWFGVLPSMKYIFKHSKTVIGKQGERESTGKWKSVLAGVGMAMLFLFIVIPLLGSADMVFGNMIESFTMNLDGDGFAQFMRYLLFILGGTLAFYGMVCVFVSERVNVNQPSIAIEQWDPRSLTVMTRIIACVYLFFSGIQVIYLFGGVFELPNGITYAEYARQGFFQLLFVTVINIAMVLLLLNLCKESRKLKHLLAVICGCTYVMIASAAYRMVLYISEYHLTFLRILVLWFLAVLSIVMVGVLYYIYHVSFHISRFVFKVVLLCYFVLSFMRPDYVIASYNISQMDRITAEDVTYLTYLSTDAVPALADIDEDQLGEAESEYDSSPGEVLNDYFYEVCQNYNHSFRYFNLGEYYSYQIAKEKVIQ